MSVNHKQMYIFMKQETERLEKLLNGEEVVPTEIPADFNQRGWDLTIVAVEKMLDKMKQARAVKGKRMTPQFFRSIFSRTLLADVDLNKFITNATPIPDDLDFQAECIKLTARLYDLQRRKEELDAANEAEAAQEQDSHNEEQQEDPTSEQQEDPTAEETSTSIRRPRRGAANE